MKQLLIFGISAFLLIGGCRAPKDGGDTVTGDTLKLSKTHQIVFADLAIGQAQIIKDDVEGFFDRIKKLDMQIQMNSVSRGDRATLLKDYKAHLQSSVMDFTDSERAFVTKTITKAFELVNAVDPNIFLPNITMIKCNMNHYGEGVFYTREDAIVIPSNTLVQQDETDFLKTMIHEIFHIYARYNPKKRDELYKYIGYYPITPPTIPPILDRRVLLNPDGVNYNYGIKVDRKTTGQEITAIPLIYSKKLNFMPAEPDFFQYLQFNLFEVDNGAVKVTRNGDTNVLIKNIAKFYEQIGTNTQYIIHPDEVLADNFILMCLSQNDPDILKEYRIRPQGKKLINDLKAIIKKQE